MTGFVVPEHLGGAINVADPVFDEWLAALPDQVEEARARWRLEIGPPYQPGGRTAWVAPATRDGQDRPMVLKVAWRHVEAAGEATGLREWAGDGTVTLFESDEDDKTAVLLLERCEPGTALTDAPAEDRDVVIADVLRRLWRTPTNEYRTLEAMCHEWADQFEEYVRDGVVTIDPGLARDGAALFRSLSMASEDDVLLVTDLHADNVLRAEREPWLVIDPKPHTGDRTYDVLQHLLNCQDRLHADPHALIDRFAVLLDLDRERLRSWLFARCVIATSGWPELEGVALDLGRQVR